ncbi:LCP family protein [Paenibacillus sp. SYP-B3998]|uniref:LCP family protein n=1 Tax=Paenibacillus sp. SYP-B3998 TaxID=2678564 RepID=A0A6G3ZXB8_9BACL|nr:LCP family protein [Paenibacillus sp. SYP-B3998]NEW06057.1 LCP family protein [Paenibacillus sp. SYP-B3998]
MKMKFWKPQWRRAFIAFLVLTGLLIGSGSVYALYLYNKLNQTIDQIAAPKTLQKTKNMVSLQQTTNLIDEPLTFLLTAIDEREGSEGSLNTDVMMLFSVNPISHQATVVSIPRDLEVKAEESGLENSHKANYFYAYYSNKNKATAIYETKKLFSHLYKVPIDYMAVINFDGFRKMIDQLGGMTVQVDMNMRYEDVSDGTNIHLDKGIQHLDGKQVLDFIRYRKSNLGTAESSDLERNQREQLVLNQLLEQLTSLNGLTAWGKMFDIIGNSVKTDIPADELRNFTSSYRAIKPANVNYIHLKGEWESPYVVIKQQDLEQALRALRKQSAISIDSEGMTN